MPTGTRVPSWRERENNKRRERRRRAMAAKIYAGLRLYGNYKLPKHGDNNEVLKALCNEAGWTVEEDGTTYRKGSNPAQHMDVRVSDSASPCSTYYQPSQYTSFNPSPASSALASPSNNDNNSLIPWLKSLSPLMPSKPSRYQHLYNHVGSISAPVTPPVSSPTAQSPRRPAGLLPDPAWIAGLRLSSAGPSSPTFSLVSSNPFGSTNGGSRMWTPGQSGTCSPVPNGYNYGNDAWIMPSAVSEEFAFGSNDGGLVKAWEGERIHDHEECVADDLELTLGRSMARSDA